MPDGTCSVPNCPRSVLARGWCAGHYGRWKRTGDVQADQPFRKSERRTPGAACSIRGCERPAGSLGMCVGHYTRLRRHGDTFEDAPIRVRPSTDGDCAVDGCGQPVKARGWCIAHHSRWLKRGDVQGDIPTKRRRYAPEERCSVTGCGRKPADTGMCKMHARRRRNTGDAGGPQLRKLWRLPPDARCEVGGCLRPVRGRSLCTGHLSRLHKTGSLDPDQPIRRTLVAAGLPCVAPGCEKPVTSPRKGLCVTHYARHHASEIESDPQRLEVCRAYQRAYAAARYRDNPAGMLAAKKRWKAAWRKANPERAKLSSFNANRRRKQRYQAVPRIPFTLDQLASRLRYWGNRCWMCGGSGETVDHVKPLAKGGAHALMNLRPACLPCNSGKGSKWPLEASYSRRR